MRTVQRTGEREESRPVEHELYRCRVRAARDALALSASPSRARLETRERSRDNAEIQLLGQVDELRAWPTPASCHLGRAPCTPCRARTPWPRSGLRYERDRRCQRIAYSDDSKARRRRAADERERERKRRSRRTRAEEGALLAVVPLEDDPGLWTMEKLVSLDRSAIKRERVEEEEEGERADARIRTRPPRRASGCRS